MAIIQTVSYLLVVFNFILVDARRSGCGLNEIRKDSGFDCANCRNYQIVRCPLEKINKCYCLDGYVRDDNTNQCVPTSSCPAPCGVNEVRKDRGSDCATCSNYQFIDCAEEIVNKCYCRDGYVRNDQTLKCVPISRCPKPATGCGCNEIRKDSGFECARCSNYQLVRCPLETINKCYCLDGYVRDDRSLQCIPTSYCPKPPIEPPCGINEVRNNSGIDCAKCSNYKLVRCALEKVNKCYCLDGYVRDDQTLQCVATSQCPKPPTEPPCGINEVRKNSGIDCAKCSNYKLVRCALEKVNKCYCLDGYVRDDQTLQCVPTSQCPKPPTECQPNAEYVRCGNTCPKTCQNRDIFETISCRPLCDFACLCKPGYILDTVTNQCILELQCPSY